MSAPRSPAEGEHVPGPAEGQHVTTILVHGGEPHIVSAKVSAVEADNLVLVAREPDVAPSEGDRVTLMFPGGDRMLHRKTRLVATLGADRWIVAAEGPAVAGERRDFYRAEIPVAAKLVTGVAADRSDCAVEMRDLAARTPLPDLDRVDADVSASGIKFFTALHPDLDWGNQVGVLVAIDPDQGPIWGVAAEVVRINQGRVVLTFFDPPTDLQEAIVTEVFRSRYGALGAEPGGS